LKILSDINNYDLKIFIMSKYPFYHTYVCNRFAEENTFGARYCQPWAWFDYNRRHPESTIKLIPKGNRHKSLPNFFELKKLLPKPFWDGHKNVIDCYWKVWELAFNKKLRKATLKNRFVSDFNSTAFNDNIFMWDSAFIALFGIYGRRAWHFQGTLDNFYCKQHPDGFICREIGEKLGDDKFQRFDPSGTGPNILPWAEWEYYRQTKDKERLKKVFPPLAAYTRWFRENRTWPSGGYWATGWSSGMDNQPRIPLERNEWYEHSHQTWVDACMQAVLANQILADMAKEINRESDSIEFEKEAKRLIIWINENLWDEDTNFYHDLRRDNSRITTVKTIGAYWGLIAEVVPKKRLSNFISHLENQEEFLRKHLVPSISADTPGYKSDGGYWKGGVWTPTNYMLLKGLDKIGEYRLSHKIAMNHLVNVVSSFVKTGTLWEYYSPDFEGKGCGKNDFVGWTGLVPTAILFENVFGLKPNPFKSTLTWDIRLLEEHGIENYPFGKEGIISIKCKKRKSYLEEPEIKVKSNISLTIEIIWNNGKKNNINIR